LKFKKVLTSAKKINFVCEKSLSIGLQFIHFGAALASKTDSAPCGSSSLTLFFPHMKLLKG
jgi:hypothetical protein